MIVPITLTQTATLAMLHLLMAVALLIISIFLLPRRFSGVLAGGFLVIWGWSLAAMLSFNRLDEGFFAWFTDPSGEKNFSALFNTSLLMFVALVAVTLLYRALREREVVTSMYWACASLLFAFLAVDEYFSIHEGIVFWRGGYLILGGIVGLFSLYMIISKRISHPRILLMFIFGLGVMGVSGVVLDAFSTQNLLDIGSLELGFVRCDGTFLGVMCRDYSNTEETFELFGALTMWLSLMALITQQYQPTTKTYAYRFVYTLGLGWIFSLLAIFWVLPTVQVQFIPDKTTEYGDLTLQGFQANRTTVSPGDTLNVTVYMRANRNLSTDYSMSVHLFTRPDATSLTQDDMELGNFNYPTRAWIPQLTVANHFRLNIPLDAPTQAGYQLVAILWEETPENLIPVETTMLPLYADGTTIVLDSVVIPPTSIPASPDSDSFTFEAGFGLSGYQIPQSVTVGEPLNAQFWWTTAQDIDLELVQFLHFFALDSDDVYVFDRVPFNRQFPTQDWAANLNLYDNWQLTLPAEMPAGRYRVQTGLYQISDTARIPVQTASGDVVQDASIVLGQIEVLADE